jgi:hypothetical protein
MLSRIAITAAFAGISWFFISKNKTIKNIPLV